MAVDRRGTVYSLRLDGHDEQQILMIKLTTLPGKTLQDEPQGPQQDKQEQPHHADQTEGDGKYEHSKRCKREVAPVAKPEANAERQKGDDVRQRRQPRKASSSEEAERATKVWYVGSMDVSPLNVYYVGE